MTADTPTDIDIKDIRAGDELFLNRVRVIQVSPNIHHSNPIQVELRDTENHTRLMWISLAAVFDHIPQRAVRAGDRVLVGDSGMEWVVEHTAHHRAWVSRADADEHEMVALSDLFLLEDAE